MLRKFPVLKIAQASSLQFLSHTRLRQIHKKIIFKLNFVQECMDTDSSILSKIYFFEVMVKLEFTLIEIYQYVQHKMNCNPLVHQGVFMQAIISYKRCDIMNILLLNSLQKMAYCLVICFHSYFNESIRCLEPKFFSNFILAWRFSF